MPVAKYPIANEFSTSAAFVGMNRTAGDAGTNERANGNLASEREPRNTILPSKPWIPEKQRLTNREALEIIEQKRAERAEKVAEGTSVFFYCTP